MSEENTPKVSAIIFLKSPSGLSLASETKPITSQNIKDYRPEQGTVIKAIQGLQKLGFTVPEASQPDPKIITLTITGKPELFEKVFDVRLKVEKQPPSTRTPGGVRARSREKLRVPDVLKETVAEIHFEEPVEPFKERVLRSRTERRRLYRSKRRANASETTKTE